MDLGSSAAAYLEWLAERGYSEWTVRHRRSYLRFFLAWCEERGISRPEELTRLVLERYQKSVAHTAKRNGEPLSFHAQHLRLAAVKALCQWLARQRLVLYNPAAELELPRLGQRLPRAVLSAAEAETLLNTPDVATPLGVRDRAILETFYSTGVRRSELIRLSIYAVDLERGTVLVREGKGKKDRFVPVGERAVAWTRRYLEEVRPSLAVAPDDGTLFLTRYGRPFTPNGMSTLIKRLVARAGLGKDGSCHMLRHTMATVMLEGGADVRYIQQMLGHASLRTTQVYTHVAIRALKAVHEATHPSARLKRAGRPQAAPAPGSRSEPRILLDEDGGDDEQPVCLAARALLAEDEDLG